MVFENKDKAFITLIVLLLLVIFAQRYKNMSVRNDLQLCKTEQAQAEAVANKEHAKRLEIVRQKEQEDIAAIEKSKLKLKDRLAEDVSPICEKANEYLIEQGRHFK